MPDKINKTRSDLAGKILDLRLALALAKEKNTAKLKRLKKERARLLTMARQKEDLKTEDEAKA